MVRIIFSSKPGISETEADNKIAAAVKSIATGSYSGNDADDRQITVGFKCSLVIVQTASPYFRWTAIPGQTVKDKNDSHNAQGTDCLLHASDGFVVDQVDANSAGVTYYYWAMSE